MIRLFNFFVLQWLGVRLVQGDGWRGENWHLLRWVWPLTGWWSRYRWIKCVWPGAEVLIIDVLAEQISRDIDQHIVDFIDTPMDYLDDARVKEVYDDDDDDMWALGIEE